MNKPLISVVMAVYNAQLYLAEAIESILGQSVSDFEFLIIDDASSDGSKQIIEDYAKSDPRIRLISNPENLGLGASLQKGVEEASGDYIARMDADDISLPKRFEMQLAYLDLHPEILALGGDHELVDAQGKIFGELIYPKLPNRIRWNLLLGNGLIATHPAVLFRKEFFEIYGDYADLRAAQDFDLWSRTLFAQPFPIANINEIVLHYRQTDGMITKVDRSRQEQIAIERRRKNIASLLGEEVDADVVRAYRTTGLAYSNLEEIISIWQKVYLAFIERFNPSDEELAGIKAKFFQRLSHYTFLNPFADGKSKRINLFKLRKSLNGQFFKELWQRKIRSLFPKRKNG